MARSKHTHRYHKVTLQFAQVWACGLPDCNHYMPQNLTPLVLGRDSICWKCGEKFVLDEENMKDNQPMCNDCKPTIKSFGDFLSNLGVK